MALIDTYHLRDKVGSFHVVSVFLPYSTFHPRISFLLSTRAYSKRSIYLHSTPVAFLKLSSSCPIAPCCSITPGARWTSLIKPIGALSVAAALWGKKKEGRGDKKKIQLCFPFPFTLHPQYQTLGLALPWATGQPKSIRHDPDQDAHFTLILWYAAKIITSLLELGLYLKGYRWTM